MASAKQVINSIKPKPFLKDKKPTTLGSVGYDNIREDIERVKKMREGSVEKVPVLDNDVVNKLYVDGKTRTISIHVTNPTASDDFLCYRFPFAVTIIAINAVCHDGTSVAFKINECDANGDNPAQICDSITATTTNTAGTITNASVDSGDYISYVSTANTGSVTKLLININFTE